MHASSPVPAPSAHGGDAERVAEALGLERDAMIDLSMSMNPFAPDVAQLAIDELTHRGRALRDDPDAMAATATFAGAIGVDSELVVLTNGGAEAISLVATHVRTGRVDEPEFSLYRRHLDSIEATAPRWRSNPSNPLGQLATEGETAGVWDEAFYPLSTGTWTRGDIDAWRLGSLTKLWSCPGLRLGYLVAPTAVAAAAVRHRQAQWSVNGLALALLPSLLARTDLPGWSTAIATMRTHFTDALSELGFRVLPTAANWVLVDEIGLRSRLAPCGVLVRDCSSFGMPGVHRVGLPRVSQIDRVVDAFARSARG